jgi:prepilin-type N-terminal cleavage/methylation domain-containing protein
LSRSERRGFTLFEVIVALVIVTLTCLAALSTVSTQLRAAERAQRAMEGAALAKSQLSLIQMLPPEDFPSIPDTLRSGTFPAPFADHTFRVEVRQVPGEEFLNEVEIVVEWPNGAYTLRSRVYSPLPDNLDNPAGGAP